MTGKLLRLTEKLYNTPHIVTQERLDSIFEYLESRNNEQIVNESSILKGEYEATELQIEDGVAILDLRGTTVYKETGMDAFCGLLSYQNVVRNIDTIVSRKDEVKMVVAFVESPGGEAFRAFETGRYVRNKLRENNIKSIAYVDGIAASGGYVLASAFDEVISNPDSEIGSIGVRIALRNPDGSNKVTYITAGENKVPFDAEGNFKPEFIEKLQKGVNETYDTFVNYVADMRRMTREAVISTKADTFSAKESKSLQLIDKIMDGEQFLNYIADVKENLQTPTTLRQISSETLVKESIEKNSQSEDKVATTTGEIVNNEVEEDVSSEQKLNKNKEDNMTDAIDNSVELTKSVEMEALIKAQDEMKSQIEALMKANQDKEAALAELQKAAAEKEAALQAELDKQEMQDLELFVKGLGLGTEAEQESLTKALFDMRNVEGVEVVTDFLEKSKVKAEAANIQISVEDKKEKEEVSTEQVRKSRINERLRQNALNVKS